MISKEEHTKFIIFWKQSFAYWNMFIFVTFISLEIEMLALTSLIRLYTLFSWRFSALLHFLSLRQYWVL